MNKKQRAYKFSQLLYEELEKIDPENVISKKPLQKDMYDFMVLAKIVIHSSTGRPLKIVLQSLENGWSIGTGSLLVSAISGEYGYNDDLIAPCAKTAAQVFHAIVTQKIAMVLFISKGTIYNFDGSVTKTAPSVCHFFSKTGTGYDLLYTNFLHIENGWEAGDSKNILYKEIKTEKILLYDAVDAASNDVIEYIKSQSCTPETTIKTPSRVQSLEDIEPINYKVILGPEMVN